MKSQDGRIQRITIHHSEGKNFPGMDESARVESIQTSHMVDDHNWGDIAYHFLIGPSGIVYEGRNPILQGDSGTKYTLEGNLLICVLGDFDHERPTAAAQKSLTELVAKQLHRFNLTPMDVFTHGELATTTCPGEYLREWITNEGRPSIQRTFLSPK